MDLIASFSSRKVKSFNFLVIRGILRESDLFFLFDTGAACPVVGVSNFFDKDDTESMLMFERILKEEISEQFVRPRSVPLKAANNQSVETFPRVCHQAIVENTTKRNFYFDISFADISIPLLGSSFIDDCAYNHAINGNINITGMKEQIGADYYAETRLLDFDKVAARFDIERCQN